MFGRLAQKRGWTIGQSSSFFHSNVIATHCRFVLFDSFPYDLCNRTVAYYYFYDDFMMVFFFLFLVFFAGVLVVLLLMVIIIILHLVRLKSFSPTTITTTATTDAAPLPPAAKKIAWFIFVHKHNVTMCFNLLLRNVPRLCSVLCSLFIENSKKRSTWNIRCVPALKARLCARYERVRVRYE